MWTTGAEQTAIAPPAFFPTPSPLAQSSPSDDALEPATLLAMDVLPVSALPDQCRPIRAAHLTVRPDVVADELAARAASHLARGLLAAGARAGGHRRRRCDAEVIGDVKPDAADLLARLSIEVAVIDAVEDRREERHESALHVRAIEPRQIVESQLTAGEHVR